MGRPASSNTIAAIPEGPMATNKAKWAAIAKWHAINSERKRDGYEEISAKEFAKHTQIAEVDIFNAGSHKEYIEAAMSLAKGQSTMWFRNEIEFLQKSAKNLRDAGEDKEYIKVALALADMLKFKDVDLSGMEDSEAKSSKEVIDEIMTLLNDDAVKSALKHEGGQVAQKVIPAILGANFKLGSKTKIVEATRPGQSVESSGVPGPDKPMDTV